MVIHKNEPDLDAIFDALSNQHRREITYALGLQSCTISQAAAMRELTLPAIHKHIVILENAKLVKRKKVGRTNVLTLNKESLRTLQHWLMQFYPYWSTD